MIRPFLTCLLILLLNTGLASAQAGADPALASAAAGYAPAVTCLGCHAEQAKAWQHSDHDWAMREANATSVLGNFMDARFSDAGVKARFFKRNGRYYVNTEGEDGKPADFLIRYTFYGFF